MKTRLQVFILAHRRKLLHLAIILPIVAILLLIAFPALSPRIDHTLNMWRFNRLGRADFLYDFDYMIYVLEENFPYEHIIYDTHGINIWENAARTRAIIADASTSPADAHAFFDLITQDFFQPMGNIGHLFALNQAGYLGRLHGYVISMQHARGSANRLFYDHFMQIFTNRRVMTFYYSALANEIEGASASTPLLEVDILEEGHVAYIKINHMPARLHVSLAARENRYVTMLNFWYRYIEDFDHLIVDLRGNPGGSTYAITRLIISPLINESLQMTRYLYYNLGEHSIAASELGILRGTRSPSSDINAYPFDRRVFDGYVANPQQGGRQNSFSGRVWILIDEITASAAEAVAIFSAYTNFATLVGENTSGVGFGPAAYFNLPNTGIIIRFDYGILTDRHGNVLAAGHGVAPHYYNREGMDALETVLAMIKENLWQNE
ncbi:MAG: S41 family peptidase [Defluviitaleaceae bacterium]|nr:S41 family peptidase [Defluviitaleaceae bacterium]